MQADDTGDGGSIPVEQAAAPGHCRSAWPLDRPLDVLDFAHVGTGVELVRVEKACGSVNLHRFHGWRAGSLILERVSYRPTGRTERKRPTYWILSRIRIACLAGMADCEWRVDDGGRARLEVVRCRTDFNALPLGQLLS